MPLAGRLSRPLVVFCLGLLCAVGCADTSTSPGDVDAGVPDVDSDAETHARDTGHADDVDGESGEVVDSDAEVDDDRCSSSSDCDGDGVSDCRERALGTAPCRADTDRDGLSDRQELDRGTDPLDPDTDSDGASDGEEVDLGLDPLSRSSYADGVDDGMRWIIGACDQPSADPVDFFRHERAGWTFGLAPSFDQYRELDIETDAGWERLGFAIYADTSAEVAGLLRSWRVQADTPQESVEQTLHAILAAANVDEPDSRGSITRFETHDHHRAALWSMVIRVERPRTVGGFRDQVLWQYLSPTLVADPLPAGATELHKRFRIYVSSVHRRDEGADDQAILNIAIAPEDDYQETPRVGRLLFDATNTTSLATFERGTRVDCARFGARPEARADIYWMIDQSESMDDDFPMVRAAAGRFYDMIEGAGLDFRLGVANMDRATQGGLRPDAGWHTSRETFLGEIDALADDPRGDDGVFHDDDEYGLQMAQSGLEFMLGLRGNHPSGGDEVRSDAELVTVFVADEEPESFQTYPLSTGAGQRLLGDFVSFFDRYSITFALTTSLAQGYREVALATGGGFADIHGAPDMRTRNLENFVERMVAEASRYHLQETPITSTLRVFVDGRWVPRSREDGYAYFPETNSIVFYGRFRPEPADTGGADHVAVMFETFTNPPK